MVGLMYVTFVLTFIGSVVGIIATLLAERESISQKVMLGMFVGVLTIVASISLVYIIATTILIRSGVWV